MASKLTAPFFEFERDLQSKTEALSVDDDKPKPYLSISNATSEALAQRLCINEETLFSFSSEAGDLIRVASGAYKKSGGDFALYNSAWSGSHTDYARVNRSDVTLSNPCLSLCWFIQPNYFQELTRSEEAMHSGFIPRCLAFDAATEYALDDGIVRSVDIFLENKWEERVHTILEQRIHGGADSPKELPCTDQARQIFCKFHNSMQTRRNRESDIATLLGKARENAIRIALTLAVMGGKQTIDHDDATGACRIVEWCISSTIEMITEARTDALEAFASKLRSRLLSPEYNGSATLRDLKKRNGIEQQLVKQLATRYPSSFRLETTKGPSGGRPSERVTLIGSN